MGRIVGLDVGERRIGVAVSDPTGTLARPVTALRTTGLDGDALKVSLDEVARLAGEDPLDAIVVGLPRRLDGSANEMTPRIERFASRLRDRGRTGGDSAGRTPDERGGGEPIGET